MLLLCTMHNSHAHLPRRPHLWPRTACNSSSELPPHRYWHPNGKTAKSFFGTHLKVSLLELEQLTSDLLRNKWEHDLLWTENISDTGVGGMRKSWWSIHSEHLVLVQGYQQFLSFYRRLWEPLKCVKSRFLPVHFSLHFLHLCLEVSHLT